MMTTVLDHRMIQDIADEPEAVNAFDRRDVELIAIIDSYNQVTEKLKSSHETLTREVRSLQKRLAEKDEELERRRRLSALGEMAAGVAHEVRNPLGGILLYATMLERELTDRAEALKVARQIASAARMLDSVVGDVLAFANPQPPNCRMTRMDSLAAEAIELLRARWGRVGCLVSMECAGGPVEAWVEGTQILRVLLNLISNGIDAAGSGGHVWVALRRVEKCVTHKESSVHHPETLRRECVEGAAASTSESSTPPLKRWGTRTRCDAVMVEVADDGPGVPVELADRIFNPFFTTKDSGTGLGLAIVHGIVEAHGGRVSVSRRVGGGAVFGVLLPTSERSRTSNKEQG